MQYGATEQDYPVLLKSLLDRLQLARNSPSFPLIISKIPTGTQIYQLYRAIAPPELKKAVPPNRSQNNR